jgi:type III restriction enzyme
VFSNATIYLNHKEKKNKQETLFDILNDSQEQKIQEFNWKHDFEYTIGNEVSSEHNIIKDKQFNDGIDENKIKVESLSLKKFDDTILKSVLLYFDAQFNSKAFLVYLKNQDIKMKFKGDFTNISNDHKFKAFLKYFSEISKHPKFNDEIGSTTFKEYKLSKLLKSSRVVKIQGKEENEFDNLAERVKNDNFFIYDKLHTDSTTEIDLYDEFKDFYKSELKNSYKSVFFIRNHLELALYTFQDGVKFYPDFILVLESLQGDIQTFQVILEAKGKHLADNENNTQKQNFLKAINNPKTKIKYLYRYKGDKKIKIIGKDFFVKKDNNYFDDVIKEINKYNKKM